jgi:hypothetical protein
MSQLPGASAATVDDHKIIKYLLDPTHSNGGAGKAKFFGRFGFSQANWVDFKKALLDHPRTNSVTKQERTKYGGDKYVVRCSLTTPDGRNPCVVSVWIIEPPDPNPRFVTAYAGP